MTCTRRPALLALPAAAVLALGACGSSDAPGGGAATDGDVEGAALQVAASFYPLQWVTLAVAGDRADVTSLTQPGTEPHDLELSPREVAAAVDADVLVTLQGFQGAVDAAADERGGQGVVDVAPAADLEPSPGTPPGEDAAEDDHEEGHEHEEAHDQEGEGHEGEEGHDHGLEEDPHFWLDPVRMSSVAEAVADGLADADPDGADVYAANLADVQAELADLDAEFSEGLATCDSRDLVTAHQAFGYLSERYDLVQRGVSGIGGEEEPGAARLAEVAQFAEANDVRTIYTETLLPADVAETVAAETGATTAVLDTLEGLTDESPGDDYPSVMRADLETLRQGQGCS
ncbi:metal ABC transporter substrate-binding protein [uncultured Pseudokineococcus sp.]|uniref:metal ABC transporter substrate-binding protein n=1 Tax=uncultured Pseudokineococcus sp. TaxID=1642928 RepID=UPI00262BCEEC|nr:metal ABC transporter substrate-binding protein [uncultured Pseudokineococcus sp.]